MSTVLVVQSDPALNDGWCAGLERSGHAVIAAGAFVDGLAYVREGGIDIVIVDSHGRDGELADFVAELDLLPDPPPFIWVSSSPRAPEKSAQIGAAAFLPKPCTAEDLQAGVKRLTKCAQGSSPALTLFGTSSRSDSSARIERIQLDDGCDPYEEEPTRPRFRP